MKSAVIVFPGSNCDRDAADEEKSIKEMRDKPLANPAIDDFVS